MTPDEKDIYRSAQQLINQHGEDAVYHADLHYMEMSRRGDERGLEVWKRIKEAIGKLQNKRPDKLH